jgi:hypothetical protein
MRVAALRIDDGIAVSNDESQIWTFATSSQELEIEDQVAA